MSTTTMMTARVTKFKPTLVFHADVENLESNHNCKEPLSIHCKRPTLNDDSSFHIIYSPWTFKIRTKENISLDLQFQIEIPKHIDWTIGLLPSYIRKLSIENSKEIARIKGNFIVLHILNRDFNNFTIKKYQELGYIFLNNQKSYEKIVTEYDLM